MSTTETVVDLFGKEMRVIIDYEYGAYDKNCVRSEEISIEAVCLESRRPTGVRYKGVYTESVELHDTWYVDILEVLDDAQLALIEKIVLDEIHAHQLERRRWPAFSSKVIHPHFRGDPDFCSGPEDEE